MYGLLCKRILLLPNGFGVRVVGDSASQLCILQNTSLIIKPFSSKKRSSSKTAEEEDKQHSFTLSYLINSCGLSPESALSASKKLHIQSSKGPDSVLTLLRNHGFTSSHISKFVTKSPVLLLANPKKTLLPKLEFFNSIGVSSDDIAKIVSYNPTVFGRSLKNQIIPCYNFLKSLVHVDKKVVTAFKRSSEIFQQNVNTHLAPNIAILKELGVPQSSISLLITHIPVIAFMKHSYFNEMVEQVKEFGFNPLKSVFVQAIYVVFAMRKMNWEHKYEVFEKWGWSKDETLVAFRKNPHFMVYSDKTINSRMDFFVNKMSWSSKVIARNPVVLCYRLEKRIIPRCSVVQVLLSKGLVKKKLSLSTFLLPKEKDFLEKFVTKFQKDVPQLLNVYQGKMDLQDVGIGSKEICGTKQL